MRKKDDPCTLVLDKISVVKDSRFYPLVAYTNIVTWLYEHDGTFDSKAEWRKEFIELLKQELKI